MQKHFFFHFVLSCTKLGELFLWTKRELPFLLLLFLLFLLCYYLLWSSKLSCDAEPFLTVGVLWSYMRGGFFFQVLKIEGEGLKQNNSAEHWKNSLKMEKEGSLNSGGEGVS